MKHIKRFNESSNNKLDNFYKDYKELFNLEPGNEYTNHELWTEVGQLTLKHDMTKQDVKEILDNYDCNFDFYNFLQSTYEEWNEEDETMGHDSILYNFQKENPSLSNFFLSLPNIFLPQNYNRSRSYLK